MSIVSYMRQRPMDESRELRLMARVGLGKCLLKLAPRCGQCDPHLAGSRSQAMTARDGDRHLRLTIGQIECLSQRLDARGVTTIRIADEDDGISGQRIWGIHPHERKSRH